MGKTVVILMGLQGSGKSTFYKLHLADDFVRVNLDKPSSQALTKMPRKAYHIKQKGDSCESPCLV